MTKPRVYLALVVVLLLAGLSIALRARTQDQTSPDQQERARAINLVRLLNTSEVVYNTEKANTDGKGRFASWDELYVSQAFKSAQDRWSRANDMQVAGGPEVLPGYYLDLLISADGQSYSIALHDKKEGDHLFSVFSDQTGIIYLGAPLY